MQLTFLVLLQCARHCLKRFTYTSLFDSQIRSTRWVIVLYQHKDEHVAVFTVQKTERSGYKRLTSIPQTAQLEI